jgi:hypothetical protein
LNWDGITINTERPGGIRKLADSSSAKGTGGCSLKMKSWDYVMDVLA